MLISRLQATHTFALLFPEDILYSVLGAAVEPENNRRLSIAYNFLLVNKCTAKWIEPQLRVYAMFSSGGTN